jgi:transposase
VAGRQQLVSPDLDPAWGRTTAATLEVIDHLDEQIKACEITLREAARDHPEVALLQTIPGVGPVLGYTIATEIGDIARFPTAKHLIGYSGLCPQWATGALPPTTPTTKAAIER